MGGREGRAVSLLETLQTLDTSITANALGHEVTVAVASQVTGTFLLRCSPMEPWSHMRPVAD